ncbi:MAG: heavy-metal-associated domain-containing protein [Rhodospirillales bacterium]|tara:strand:- start:18780 stop:19118 length:339 start_codon:yes stop_codon:yes gene_type:complete
MIAFSRRAALRRMLGGLLLAVALMPGPISAKETGTAYALGVDGLACPFCGYGVEKQLMRIDGVISVEIDLESGTVTTTMAAGRTLGKDTAQKAVEAAGFTLRSFQELGSANK